MFTENSRVGTHATIPWLDSRGRRLSQLERDGFHKVRYEPIDLSQYIDGSVDA